MKKPSKNNTNEEDCDMMHTESKVFSVRGRPISSQYLAVVDEQFEHTEQFQDLVECLDNCSEGDQVTINLSTPGGALFAVLPLISALRNTEAYVHVNCVSDVASAGTFIMMLADSVYINDYATIMIHDIQFGAGGNGGRVKAVVDHTLKARENLVKDVYNGFLTDSEISDLYKGVDFYFTPQECFDRFKKRDEIIGKFNEALVED